MKILEQIVVPQESVNDESVLVIDLHFTNGDEVNSDEVILDIETSKTVISLTANQKGYIYYLVNLDDEVIVGTTLAYICSTVLDQQEFEQLDLLNHTKNEKSNEALVQLEDKQAKTKPVFSKKALSILQVKQISKDQFIGFDFVTEDIVLKHLGIENNTNDTKAVLNSQKSDIKSNQFLGVIDKQFIKKTYALSRQKRLEAANLSFVPAEFISNISVSVNSSKLLAYTRRAHQLLKFSLAPTLVSIVSKTLLNYEQLNAFCENDTIHIYDKINIGYAVDGVFGLKVLTIYDSNQKDIKHIEQELVSKIKAYESNTLKLEDISHSTFSITDLYSHGISEVKPLINGRQACILGISSSDKTSKIFKITASFDHRLSDGKTIAEFLRTIKKGIEDLIFED